MPTTVIRNADWVVAWDEAAGRQTGSSTAPG